MNRRWFFTAGENHRPEEWAAGQACTACCTDSRAPCGEWQCACGLRCPWLTCDALDARSALPLLPGVVNIEFETSPSFLLTRACHAAVRSIPHNST